MARALTGLSAAVAFVMALFAPALLAAPSDDLKNMLEQGKAAAAYAEG